MEIASASACVSVWDEFDLEKDELGEIRHE